MLCAVRIHMLNESDLDVVCPSTSGAFWTSDGNDKRCEGGGFNWTRPISIENENKTITGELKNVQSLKISVFYNNLLITKIVTIVIILLYSSFLFVMSFSVNSIFEN